MIPQYTEFAVVRPKRPYEMIFILRLNMDDEYELGAVLRNSTATYAHEPQETCVFPLDDYRYGMTVNGRDEYVHPDDYNEYIKDMVAISIKNLTNKLNLL
jgi:hypothetical protein